MGTDVRPHTDVLEVVSFLLKDLKSRYGLVEQEILDQIKGKPSVTVPVSLFTKQHGSPLEVLCKYLKDQHHLEYKSLSKLLNRSYRAVWISYKNASKKQKSKLVPSDTKIVLPVSIFQDRKLSVMEAVVVHLKDNFSLKLIDIATLLHRDQRNVWSMYHRAKNKWKNS